MDKSALTLLASQIRLKPCILVLTPVRLATDGDTGALVLDNAATEIVH